MKRNMTPLGFRNSKITNKINNVVWFHWCFFFQIQRGFHVCLTWSHWTCVQYRLQPKDTPWMPQPMQQLLFTYGLQQAGQKWGKTSWWPLAPLHNSVLLFYFFFHSVWRLLYPDMFFHATVIIHDSAKTVNRSKEMWLFSCFRHRHKYSRLIGLLKWNVYKNLNVIIMLSPFLLAQRLWSFLVLKRVDLSRGWLHLTELQIELEWRLIYISHAASSTCHENSESFQACQSGGAERPPYTY